MLDLQLFFSGGVNNPTCLGCRSFPKCPEGASYANSGAVVRCYDCRDRNGEVGNNDRLPEEIDSDFDGVQGSVRRETAVSGCHDAVNASVIATWNGSYVNNGEGNAPSG